jgi:hypothetical protein
MKASALLAVPAFQQRRHHLEDDVEKWRGAVATNIDVILRSARRARLEGWQQPHLPPSFETLALRARSSG